MVYSPIVTMVKAQQRPTLPGGKSPLECSSNAKLDF